MLVFVVALALPPVLLSFALADDFRVALVRSTIGVIATAGLLAAVTIADISRNEPPPQTAQIIIAGH